jgi:hypothetical protein
MSKVEHSIWLIDTYGPFALADYQKQWLIDQVMRTLLEEKYEGWRDHKEKTINQKWETGSSPYSLDL